MTSRLLVIDDDPQVLNLIRRALSDYSIVAVASGEEGARRYAAEPFDAVICDVGLPDLQGFDVIRLIRERNPAARVLLITGHDRHSRLIASLRESIVDFLFKPFSVEDLRTAVANVLASEEEGIEVISATPQWIELRVPASFQIVSRLGKFFDQFHAEISQPERDNILTAFRELLMNAVEHGCRGDVGRRITICCLRLSRVVLYRINDPGGGFSSDDLAHAAVGNPPDDPLRHMQVREELGMRSGGFGILWARGIADELIYSDRGNDVIFARYLKNNDK